MDDDGDAEDGTKVRRWRGLSVSGTARGLRLGVRLHSRRAGVICA